MKLFTLHCIFTVWFWNIGQQLFIYYISGTSLGKGVDKAQLKSHVLNFFRYVLCFVQITRLGLYIDKACDVQQNLRAVHGLHLTLGLYQQSLDCHIMPLAIQHNVTCELCLFDVVILYNILRDVACYVFHICLCAWMFLKPPNQNQNQFFPLLYFPVSLTLGFMSSPKFLARRPACKGTIFDIYHL